ncbi:hypothetical protein SAMN05518668_104368 [Sphingobium sp. YR657]|uniref:hypothetical protein n=1 Tax=Sphingobium sp. YR657 TaxID=1884366 RepID=UPI000921BD98|nr:hypothetical protein [Sphingobium sp. YR657]SHL96753.1 hypothetical protein SAMN05518668_104368 [Sphingobium sp. YR657]
MPTSKGKSEVNAVFDRLPAQLVDRVLRGAGRAAANVVAEEARDRVTSDKVRAAIKVRTVTQGDRIIAKVRVDMGRYNLPLWLEYGTYPHFISVDDSQREGMSVGKINQRSKEGSLVIGGSFVGETVWHPGAQAHPFLRPALDIKEADAIKAAQQYISTRVRKGGIVGTDEGDEQ